MIIAIIPARKGSKRILNKNIKKFNGKPIISYSIKAALKSNLFDEIIVSTDSSKIAKQAKIFGVKVPFLRPKKISSDNSKEILAWKHAINFYKKRGKKFDAIVSLPCTSPLRLKKDILNCISKFETLKYDTIITVRESVRNPFFNMVKKNRNNNFEIVNKPKKYIHNRQHAPKTYDVCTICFISKINFVLKSENLLEGKVGAVKIPKERSIDIDNKLDFVIAKKIYEKRL